MFGERASPVSFAGPKRFHPPPLTLQQLPPIEGLILSHDHYDHLDVPTIEFLALRVQRYFVPLGVKARLVEMGVPAERVQELDGAVGESGGAHAAPAHISPAAAHRRNARCGPLGIAAASAHLLQRRLGDFEGFRRSAGASAASTWR